MAKIAVGNWVWYVRTSEKTVWDPVRVKLHGFTKYGSYAYVVTELSEGGHTAPVAQLFEKKRVAVRVAARWRSERVLSALEEG